jgi:hypothetical protein
MNFFRSSCLLSAVAVCSAVAPGCTVSPQGESVDSNDGVAETAAALTAPVATVGIVQLSSSARVLQLSAPNGSVVANYYPGFFRALLRVPDVQSNTAAEISQSVAATYLLATAFNPRTAVVSVAVRGFIYAETSFDMVFRINTRSSAFRAAPMNPAVAELLPFDGRRNGLLPTAQTPTRPFIDISPNGLGYATSGRLIVQTSGASDAESTIAYNPDATVASCIVVNGLGRCPVGF